MTDIEAAEAVVPNCHKPTLPLDAMRQAGLFDPTTVVVTVYANCGHPDVYELQPGGTLTVRGEPARCTECNAAAHPEPLL